MARQMATTNAGWPIQLRFAVHGFRARVAEFWTLAAVFPLRDSGNQH
jgi:hypothetical protein